MTTWREALEQYYQTHETLNEENRAWLKSHVLMDVDLIANMGALDSSATDATPKVIEI